MDTKASPLEKQPAAAKTARRTHGRRGGAGACLLLTALGAGLGLMSFLPQAPRLVWNFTHSVPLGLYRVSQVQPSRGDFIAIAPMGATREALDTYGVLPAGNLLLKQLAAIRSDTVCREETIITINGAIAAVAKLRSSDGRLLPVWTGCRTLGSDEILALAPHPSSFDGRYFGPIDASQIVGVVSPLITFPIEGGS